MREALFSFKVRKKLTQKELGDMFSVSQGTVSEALRTTSTGERRFSVEKLDGVPKPKHVKGPLYALHVEKTMGIGQLPWDIASVASDSE
ncbi:MAG: hypothetical protein CMJ76_00055 [Planctomycetaceae bacterium]|jgi:hypothetical protein|nr:hypothetical protein [Planctomycetaceae bacterium]|tara:strand:+ start:1675 stop:1941 length:267 start_codon:yes stop_codon:yes gene_type:complete